MKKWPVLLVFFAMFFLPTSFVSAKQLSATMEKKFEVLCKKAPNLNKKVLKLSLIAWSNAQKKGLIEKPMLTVIDYSRPSYQKRLWVFDLKHNRSLYNTWVAHGKNSGNVRATSFSNRFSSRQSSLGVFLTDNSYVGGHVGYALRLRGLEPGFNSHAYDRATVIHGAWYVSQNFISKYGRIGRSWGCPAVSKSLSRKLINTIKHHSLVFAYYPNKYWLSHSRYLRA